MYYDNLWPLWYTGKQEPVSETEFEIELHRNLVAGRRKFIQTVTIRGNRKADPNVSKDATKAI